MLLKDKNGKLVYWWNLPIDELEEMADEDGKIKQLKKESKDNETNKCPVKKRNY